MVAPRVLSLRDWPQMAGETKSFDIPTWFFFLTPGHSVAVETT